MSIRLLAFGIAKEIVGKSELILKVKSSVSSAELKQILIDKYPTLPDFMLAVNQCYADDDQIILANDTVAIIPPTNGG